MKYYKELRVCRLCKKRFTVDKSGSRNYYCSVCIKRVYPDINKDLNNTNDSNENEDSNNSDKIDNDNTKSTSKNVMEE